MKRWIAIVLVLGLLCGMTACAQTNFPAAQSTTSEPTKGVHVHVFESASCTEEQICKICGFSSGNGQGTHSFVQNASDCSILICQKCGAVEVNGLNHSWSTPTCNAPQHCIYCGKQRTKIVMLEHSWVAIDCDTKRCSRCNACFPREDGHVWEELFDGFSTKAQCTICGAISCPDGNHNWILTCIGRHCTDCLRYEGGESGDHDWKEATCTTPMTCLTCGTTKGSVGQHCWQEATCMTPRTCSECGATQGVAGGHNWIDATCIAPQTCGNCGTTQGSVGEHNWKDATCTAPKTCSSCGATQGSAKEHDWVFVACNLLECIYCCETKAEEGGHYWVGGSCLEPKTCLECGVSQETAPGHNWNPATCNMPMICNDCGARMGSPTGKHNPVVVPGYRATCTTSGLSDGSRCADCNATITPQKVISAYGHGYNPGSSVCKYCGENTGGSAVSKPINISIPPMPILRLGDIRINDCKAVASPNPNGTYDVSVYIWFTNISSVERIGGVWCDLSGLQGEGTAIALKPGEAGYCTVEFRNVPGGDYTVRFY